ncbi:MAG TPA: ribonuclease III, partial [Chloroflexota bacterium]
MLDLALTHRSSVNESASGATDEGGADNERLEFLGDAILGAVVAEELYRLYPTATEGGLTVMRAELVQGTSLAQWARQLDLGDSLVLGRGEARAGGQIRDALLAGAFEAVVGALYLDRGYRAVRRLVLPLVAEALPSLAPSPRSRDAKSELQRRMQALTGMLPKYQVVATEGPEHRPTFTVEVQAGPSIVAQ